MREYDPKSIYRTIEIDRRPTKWDERKEKAEKTGNKHDVWDAVGLAMWALVKEQVNDAR